jgi:hypothetical protein
MSGFMNSQTLPLTAIVWITKNQGPQSDFMVRVIVVFVKLTVMILV